VAWQGVAIVIPGRSHSGKSCLVAELVRAGATYYSDEYAVFDAGGRVHPYPKALSLRGADGARPVRMTAEMLGGRNGGEPLQVGTIVITRFDARAAWRPRPVSPGLAVLRLLENTVAARARPDAALTILGRVASRSRALMGHRGSAEEVARMLFEETNARVRPEANPRLLA
jgi:hypothetical protein